MRFLRQNSHGLASVMLAAALIAGEALGFAVPQMAALWPWAACAAVMGVCVAVGWRVPFSRFALAGLAGVALAWRSECGRLAVERMSHGPGAGGSPPAFELTVEGDATLRESRRKDGWTVRFNSHIAGMAVRVVAPVQEDGRIPALGERWRCAGWLSQRRSAANRYSSHTLWVMSAGHMKRLSAAHGGYPRMLYRRLSDRLARHVDTGLGWCRDLAAFNQAMLLGRRTGMAANRRKSFAAAGTLHVFAISGLHVMLVAGLMRALLERAGAGRRLSAACTIPLLAAYVMLSGARPSAVRAALMTGLWLGGELAGRKADSLAAWGSAALIVYGLSPKLVFDAGCALSFSVMLGILLWLRWSGQFATPLDWMRRAAARELALGDGRQAARLMAWEQRGARILSALGISFAAWIAGVPIVARVFGNITFGGLVANVAVVPLAGMTVMLGMSGIVASLVAAPAGALFNMLAAGCTWLMASVSEMVACCPGLAWETLPWSWCDCCLWYGSWLALFAVLSRHLPPREWIPVQSWRQEEKGNGDGTNWR